MLHLGKTSKLDCARFAIFLHKICYISAKQVNLIALDLLYFCIKLDELLNSAL